MDWMVKSVLWQRRSKDKEPFRPLPLELVTVRVGNEKITPDKKDSLRFWAHKKLARSIFDTLKILHKEAFNQVAWRSVLAALHEVPEMFQKWACKQVHNIADTNGNVAKRRSNNEAPLCPKCPSCTIEVETCQHVLQCNEEGRVEVLL